MTVNWYNLLLRFLNQGGSRPGPIDNSLLFKPDPDEPGELREGLAENVDFVKVSEEAWLVLVMDFGIEPGQKPVTRKVG